MPRYSNVFVVEFPDGGTERCHIDLATVYAGGEVVSPTELAGAVIRQASAWGVTRLRELGFDLAFEPSESDWRTTTIRLTDQDSLCVSELARLLNTSRNTAMLTAIRDKYEQVMAEVEGRKC